MEDNIEEILIVELYEEIDYDGINHDMEPDEIEIKVEVPIEDEAPIE